MMKNKKNKKRQKLSDHFSRKDFQCTLNPDSEQFKISAGLIGALELLRTLANNRIEIIKGFQSTQSAEKEGKVKRNFHTQGLAANIRIEGLSLYETFILAEKIPEITGIGLNEEKNYIHIRVNKAKERNRFIEGSGIHDIELDENGYQKHIIDKLPKE